MGTRERNSVKYSHLLKGGTHFRRDGSFLVTMVKDGGLFRIDAKNEDANERLWTVKEPNFNAAVRIFRHKELVSE